MFTGPRVDPVPAGAVVRDSDGAPGLTPFAAGVDALAQAGGASATAAGTAMDQVLARGPATAGLAPAAVGTDASGDAEYNRAGVTAGYDNDNFGNEYEGDAPAAGSNAILLAREADRAQRSMAKGPAVLRSRANEPPRPPVAQDLDIEEPWAFDTNYTRHNPDHRKWYKVVVRERAKMTPQLHSDYKTYLLSRLPQNRFPSEADRMAHINKLVGSGDEEEDVVPDTPPKRVLGAKRAMDAGVSGRAQPKVMKSAPSKFSAKLSNL